MCVNGSLIRSSTWRSSSVSAPCISSSICLPSSPERSRTMRGSFCQALPIGCIRVFMTPSCSSAVTLDSRCSGTLNSVSSLRREISRSWLRVKHQLGDHGHQMFERVDVDADRLVGDLVGFLDVGVGGSGASWPVLPWQLPWRLPWRLPARPAWRRAQVRPAWRRGPARAWARARLRSRSRGRRVRGRRARLRRDAAGVPAPGRPACPWQLPGDRGLHRRGGDHGDRLGLGMVAAFGHRMQLLDQVFVGALGLGLGGLEAGQNLLNAVDRGQDQRHGFGLDRHAVAEFAHQRLAGMGQRFQPRQPQEAAGALDGVDQAEDVIQNLRVARVLLEPHQLIVDRIQALAGFGQKLPQQIIHETGLRTHRHATSTRLTERGQLLCKAFNIGCSNGKERDQQRDKTAEMNSAACFQRLVNHALCAFGIAPRVLRPR